MSDLFDKYQMNTFLEEVFPQIIGKIMLSIFCLLVCMATWVQWTEYVANYIASAYALSELKESWT